jgi:hypothetical protein
MCQRICRQCGKRPARHYTKPRKRGDGGCRSRGGMRGTHAGHELCRQCYRAEMDRQRVWFKWQTLQRRIWAEDAVDAGAEAVA